MVPGGLGGTRPTWVVRPGLILSEQLLLLQRLTCQLTQKVPDKRMFAAWGRSLGVFFNSILFRDPSFQKTTKSPGWKQPVFEKKDG